ncbi:excinuclease ABC subunit UvrC [Jonesia quinghaiensis]|uniref:excinuclease ABC subunit UvrC n=1 Tax=Jonesia quinghaiensis TaxID=262806 RepID=UPI0004221DA0|nr:excinuclease ABC subunit UvrC [Jonesia quinghaiensis]
MADPATYRPAPGEIPTNPGVYRFRDAQNRVIYVGKAKNLRSRLSSYFQDVSALHPRTQTMVTTAAGVEWTIVGTEVEALALEYTWIKEFDPRFNVKYRDDKSYPYLSVSMSQSVPRAFVMRGKKKPGDRYFGPFGHAWAIRETLDQLLRVFPVRTCTQGVYNRAKSSGRPCLLGYIDKCSAPCTGKISEEDHRDLAEDLCDFLAGDTGRFIRELRRKMQQAAGDLDFEQAARLRDDIGALERALEKNAVVLSDATDADVFAVAHDELEAAVQVFHVRGGRIRGQRGWVAEKVEALDERDFVEHLLQQVYGESAEPQVLDVTAQRDAVPREVLVPVLPHDAGTVASWLSGLRGAKVDLRVPQRGEKAALAQTVLVNAEQSLRLHKSRRAGDLTSRSEALRQIHEALDLDEAPLRIECFDISHNQGTYQSASMVVFEDGLAKKSGYRLFNIRGESGDGAVDDTAAMYEVITRRFKNYVPGDAASPPAVDHGEVSAAAEKEPQRFAYDPSLVVVDGGAPQVAAAVRALRDLGISDIAVCGLAKRLEELWVPDDDFPVILERHSEGLYLLQRLRDEAHRFAITAHRRRRSQGMVVSELDGVAGVGPSRQKALLKHFGSVKRLREASVEAIAQVEGFGPKIAENVVAALHPSSTDEP